MDWGSPQIRRFGPGRYDVDLFQLAGTYSKSTALVTARDGGASHCKVNRWRPDGSIVKVAVD